MAARNPDGGRQWQQVKPTQLGMADLDLASPEATQQAPLMPQTLPAQGRQNVSSSGHVINNKLKATSLGANRYYNTRTSWKASQNSQDNLDEIKEKSAEVTHLTINESARNAVHVKKTLSKIHKERKTDIEEETSTEQEPSPVDLR